VEKPAFGLLFSLLTFGIAFFVGYRGNELHRARREAEGFRKETTVQGQNPAHVLGWMGIPKAYAQAYSVGGVVAASILTILALHLAIFEAALVIAGEKKAVDVSLSLWGPALVLWVRSLRGPLSLLKGLAWVFVGFLLATMASVALTMLAQ